MYLKWKTKTIDDFSDDNIESLYNQGYLFGRTGKGEMYQSRSLRIKLDEFKLSSENKRILKKIEEVDMKTAPLPYTDYDWTMHKLGKDFYDKKFGDKTFSANKIKELMTDPDKSNFNKLFIYNDTGYCISLETKNIIHYCYPFYDLDSSPNNMGLGMMLKAVLHAQELNKQYFYLGTVSRPGDVYKLQFSGLEWFDGQQWQDDLAELKKILKDQHE